MLVYPYGIMIDYIVEDEIVNELTAYTLYKNCKIDCNLDNVPLYNIRFEDCDFTGTCLDPMRTPNWLDTEKFNHNDTYIGFRSECCVHLNMTHDYKEMETYEAPYFSVSDTECHPGLYVCPTIEDASMYSRNLVVVEFDPYLLHKAGGKYRVKQFTVIGHINL